MICVLWLLVRTVCDYCIWGGGVSAELNSECYNSRGTDYRGVANTTVSGGQCLTWNSDLLYDELHVGTVDASPLSGLGAHAFCRYAGV